MKRKILIADKDASLKDAFRIIFSEDTYEILYAASAKDVEREAATARPEIYIVNVNLLKSSGVDVYRKLQKDKFLDSARFFFMKDENDTTELLGFQAEGVIEKPINFFKVHERIAKEDDVMVLVDEVIETGVAGAKEATVREDIDAKVGMGEGLVRELGSHAAATTEDIGPALEAEMRRVLNVTMEEIVPRFVDRMTPVLSTFVEDYTRRVLYEIAEKVIREEIDKLLKESTP